MDVEHRDRLLAAARRALGAAVLLLCLFAELLVFVLGRHAAGVQLVDFACLRPPRRLRIATAGLLEHLALLHRLLRRDQRRVHVPRHRGVRDGGRDLLPAVAAPHPAVGRARRRAGRGAHHVRPRARQALRPDGRAAVGRGRARRPLQRLLSGAVARRGGRGALPHARRRPRAQPLRHGVRGGRRRGGRRAGRADGARHRLRRHRQRGHRHGGLVGGARARGAGGGGGADDVPPVRQPVGGVAVVPARVPRGQGAGPARRPGVAARHGERARCGRVGARRRGHRPRGRGRRRRPPGPTALHSPLPHQRIVEALQENL
ncbi:hypothetical protein PVAP13_2KG375781 [Panicum virgatum]|uniref:Uncharacterized protein n=1 Tax=Panicum virgatum TaxID=38727 RepID=A0A8T0WET3_PANVG|nr:hypothetical protein PVAP13_2KG375781 [Panicum virgatum]